MEKKEYSQNGYLVISELETCPFWESDDIHCYGGRTEDCFYCAYADFRSAEYINKAEEMLKSGVLYSVCRNEKNKRPGTSPLNEK